MSTTNQLSQLERAELVRPTPEYSLGLEESAYIFKHVLVQDTAYQSLLKNERRAFHLAAARVLQTFYPDAPDENAALLAEHYWHAEAWDSAADFSLRAGNTALRVYAMREAMQHFERAQAALEKIPDAPHEKMIDALLGWAQAAQKYRPHAEQFERLKRAEQMARALNDRPRLARALYGIGGVYTAQGHGLRAYEPLTECFLLANELGDERMTIMPTYFMGMATLDSNPRDAISLFERTIELAQRYQDTDMEAVTWSAIAWAHARVGEFQSAQAAIARGQEMLPRVQSPMVASDVDLFAGWAFLEMDVTEQGTEYGLRALKTARGADNYDCVCGAHLCVGFNQLNAQRLPNAQTEFREAIRESEFSGAAVLENAARAGLAMTQFYGGRGDAIEDLEQVYARSMAMDDVMGTMTAAQALGGMYAQRGDVARAESNLDVALEFFRRNQMAPALARTLEMLAQVYEMTARPTRAQAARAEARKWLETLQHESRGATIEKE